MQFKTFLTISAAALALGAGAATAQTVDYDSLQELFGEPATTSAIGQPQRLSDAPVNMSIVTAEEIRRSGLRNIPDIIDRLAGVSVARVGAESRDVTIRGYNRPNPNRLLVLVNGRQVYLDTYGYNIWSLIPVQLEEIQQIEVVRGPNAALFGFNAVAGVVNIVTKNPLYTDESAATARVGTNGYLEGSGFSSFQLGDRLGLRVSAGGFSQNEFDYGPFSTVADDRQAERATANVELLAQLTDKVQLGAEFSYANLEGTDITAFAARFPNDFKMWSGRLSLHADTDYGLITFRAYHNGSTTQYGPNIPWDNQTTVVQLEDVFKVGADDTVRVGLEYRNNAMDVSQFITPGIDNEIGYEVISGSAMWNHAFSPSFNVVAAARYDWLMMTYDGGPIPGSPLGPSDFDREFGAFSANLGAVWRPTEHDTVRATVARASVLPSLIEFGAIQAPDITSFPAVDPTVVTNVELSYDRKIDAIDGTLRLAGFYQLNEDMRDTTMNPVRNALGTFGVWISQNVGDSSLFGLEASIDGRRADVGPFDELRWNANVTGLFVNDSLSGGMIFDYEKSTPAVEAELGVGATIGRFDADIAGRFVSHRERPIVTSPLLDSYARVKIDAYATLEASLAYHVTDAVTARLSVEQIGERRTGESGSISNEQRAFLSLGVRL